MHRNLAAGGGLFLVGGLSGLLAACGDDDAETTTTTGLTQQDVDAATGTTDVQTYDFYQAPAFDAGPVEAKYVSTASSLEALTAIRAGTPHVDVTTFDPNISRQLEALNALVPVDTALLSNYEQIAPEYRDFEGFKIDGEAFGIPYAATQGLLAWNDSVVPEPSTPDELLSEQYRDAIALGDFELVTSAGLMLGADLENFTEADLDAAVAYLEELKPNVRTFYSLGEEVDLLSRGDVSVVWQTFGSLLTAVQDANPDVRANFLGAVTFVDAWGVVEGADLAKALSWIDQTISEQGQASFVETSGSLPTVEAASKPELYPPEVAELSFAELIELAPIKPGHPVEPEGDQVSRDQVDDAWSEYMASF